MNIKILIAAHKQCDLPKDNVYLPVQVGKALHPDLVLEGYQPDNEGENISDKNANFCELTAIYWGWKNVDADYVGLVHYRRYLGVRKDKDKLLSVLTREETEKLCGRYDIILPKKRRYYIETIWSHYKHTHDISHLEKTRAIIEQYSPEYLKAYDIVMNRTWAHMFNMFIMKKELMNDYCSWMFPILFELEKQVDLKGLSIFDARLFGRVSEFLLDVWILKKNIPYKEVKMIQIGDENWPLKIKSFLMAKFFGRKYSQSR
jgi:hypothetical protein